MITGWSPVAAAIYGYRPEAIIGCDSAVLLPAWLAMAAVRDDAGAIIGVASTSRLLPAVAASALVPQEDRERLRAQMEQAQRLEGPGFAGGAA